MSKVNVESFADEHEAFAASRVSQYVYVPTKDSFFMALDQHADTLECDVKPPLVLLGNEGSGKSALLANWVSKRKEHRHRDEFLFQHFVGCTTPSLQLLHTLFRLETALKDFFQLREMKVPDTEVELRWSLNRFLEAASKKHSPARITIVIDGINRLKAEGAPDGALHWLPTELPPCVRFIVSTVEFERNTRSKKDGSPHRTFVELARRQCPMLRIEPLDVTTRQSVISAFTSLYPGSFELTEAQQFKIVTAGSSAQPMFLRTLLQALRLATQLTEASMDQLLEKFLGCATAHELIDKNLNVLCQTSFGGEDQDEEEDAEETVLTDLLGKMFAEVYVSRTGLTEAEIWGLIKMVSQMEPEKEQSEKLMSILKDFTMVVNDMYSFSHEIYREVIFQKYVCSRTSLIRWHNILARFFGQLPPCDRKLVALPYHLEMAGSWSKVKNCLTDIEMFQLWWTPKFKFDFIKFWASLTKVNPAHKEKKRISNNNNNNRKKNGKDAKRGANAESALEADAAVAANRPTYDPVEEYVKSLDEYRTLKHPQDEEVAGIILEIADFLLEFATLGHEQNADVPNLIHPPVLAEDLKSVGVPYIEVDEEGRSSLVYPDVLSSYSNKQKIGDDGGPAGMDAATKAIEDVPVCTTYYFHRWMWIQFPFIALGNCNERYTQGVHLKVKDEEAQGRNRNRGDDAFLARGSKTADDKKGRKGGKKGGTGGRSVGSDNKSEMSKSWSVDTFKLPELKFHRKAAKSVPRVNHDIADEANAMNSKVAQRISALQDSIQNLREEYDFVVQQKSIVGKRVQEMKDAVIDLQRTAEMVYDNDDALAAAEERTAAGEEKYNSVKLLNKNLLNLNVIAARHPANVPALIQELQTKVEQDEFLLHEIKKRLWEQKFEKQTHSLAFRNMKTLVAGGVEMHNRLLEYRYNQKKILSQQALEDQQALQAGTTDKRATRTPKSKSSKHADKNRGSVGKEPVLQNETQSWEDVWGIISSRTGIIEPEAFFQRINNGKALVEQINTIKKASESRLDSCKTEVVSVESELEEVRYEASFAGVQSSKEHQKQLGEKQQRLKQIKEKTEAAEQLEQRVVAGLAHISDILFIPKSEDDAPVINLVRDIEAVLDTLINEREKQQQSQTDSQSRMLGNRDSTAAIPETHNRSPELDFVVAKHEQPRVRLPKRLPSRPSVGGDGHVRISGGAKANSAAMAASLLGIAPVPSTAGGGLGGPGLGSTGYGTTVPGSAGGVAGSMSATHNAMDVEDEDDEEGTWDRTFVKSASHRNLRQEMKKAKNSLLATT